MKYDEAGVYEVPLSATDECSNETVRNREVLVAREIIAGDNITLEQDGNTVTISADVCGALDECPTIEQIVEDIRGKQDTLTAGENITIENNVISSTGGGETYTAGNNITIENNVISATVPDISDLATKQELSDGLDAKQDTLTAGSNITIENGVISATDTTYTAGDNITIENGVISADDPDLSNYYTKSETYNKAEVDALIDAIETGDIQIVQSLPQTGEPKVIYFVPKQSGGYTEYMYINNAWEEIGDTDIDLSNYYDKSEVDALIVDFLTCADLANCQTISDMQDDIDGKVDKVTGKGLSENDYTDADKAIVDGMATTYATKAEIADFITCSDLADCQTITDMQTEIDGKQDALTAGQNIQIAQDGTISATDTTYEPATQQANGLMSSADKTKLDGMTPEDYLTCANVLDCQSVSDALDAKQDSLTAGDNITIAHDNTISAEIDPATDSAYGTIKLNPDGGVTLNADGQLEVDGIWGHFPGGGLYYPLTADPTNVGSYTAMMTDAVGVYVSARHLDIIAGANLTLKSSHVAGSTEYRLANNFNNRLQAVALKDGRLTLSLDTAGEYTVPITSILFEDGTDVVPYSGSAISGQGDIIITVSESANPDSATNKVRGYGKLGSNDVVSVGQGNGVANGKALQVGQSLRCEGNQVIEVGNMIYVKGNNNAGFGRSHIITKEFSLFAGQGHDGTNGGTGVTAVGEWSVIGANTKFVVGNGTGDTVRKNLFEVIDDNGATGVIMVSPGGNKFELTVDDNGNLTTTPIV